MTSDKDLWTQGEMVRALENLLELAKRGALHQVFLVTDAYDREPQYLVTMLLCCEHKHRCELGERVQTGADLMALDTSDYPAIEAPKLNG